ncbi:MAG: hypothetical protein AB4057_16885 [Crocosphaera sp.]
MSNKNTAFDNIHPYREALHTLLYKYPDGLSTIDIADSLRLSDSECKHLLEIEEIREAVESDPYTGTLTYTSKRKIQPTRTLEQELELLHQKKLDSTQNSKKHHTTLSKLMRVLISRSCFLSFGVGLILLSLVRFSFLTIIIPVSFTFSNDKNNREDFIEELIDAEIASQKRIRLYDEKIDLEKRIAEIENSANQSQCDKYWSQNKECYLEGRLLTKVKYERQITQMRLRINEIEEILSFYDL